MLKHISYKNTYFIIGALILIILIALFSNYNTNIEGFTHRITREPYNSNISCGTNWNPASSGSGFNFRNRNYNTIHMLSSNLDDITQLFNNYANTTFNIDCSNVLYNINRNVYSKYVYNNSAIKYNPSLLTKTSSIGNFYDCFARLVDDTKPTIYFDYNSRNSNRTELNLTIINANNRNNIYRFNIGLKRSGKTYMDEKIKDFLKNSHSTYSSTTPVSGFVLKMLRDKTRCDITIYKNRGSPDELKNTNAPNIPTLINDLSPHILSMYNRNDRSSVSRYNLITTSSRIKYMYGTVEYAGNQDDVIVQIPNFTS